jgi:hypothetical protein
MFVASVYWPARRDVPLEETVSSFKAISKANLRHLLTGVLHVRRDRDVEKRPELSGRDGSRKAGGVTRSRETGGVTESRR